MTLGMTARGGRPPTALRIFHWVIMGIIVVLSVADFVIWIVFSFGIYELIRVYEAITITLDVVYWVASWEVTALAIYVFVRAMKSGSIIKKPALALLCSSTIFSVLNFMRAVDNIRWFARVWDWDDKGQYDSATATSFLEIFFCIGIYGSLLGFCLLSGHLAQRLEEGKSTDGNKPQPLGEVGSRPWSQRAALNPLVEADASHPIVEADGSNNILEMGGSKPIFEADSNQYQRHELEPTSFLGTDSSPRE
ncbi:hypothetical protein N7457_004120 [Penicillium paradoxum]|uniref:uncharacterized protein n=1 Tax=Penicillium paradoxum TaxID=176176 RepID=UPI0025476DF5|nr:uncharacterized protein N7457_004120 [Penicillium paradoxum]KAJ5782346.1 hypothetical protein N7457_004120 [Penicillium paradoxum]